MEHPESSDYYISLVGEPELAEDDHGYQVVDARADGSAIAGRPPATMDPSYTWDGQIHRLVQNCFEVCRDQVLTQEGVRHRQQLETLKKEADDRQRFCEQQSDLKLSEMKQEMEHKEKLRQVEWNDLQQQLGYQKRLREEELAATMKLNAMKIDQLNEKHRQEMDQKEEQHQRVLQEVKDAYEQQFAKKDEEKAQLHHTIAVKDNQIKELQLAVAEVMKEKENLSFLVQEVVRKTTLRRKRALGLRNNNIFLY